MQRLRWILTVVLVGTSWDGAFAQSGDYDEIMGRGDVNNDANVDISDAVALGNYMENQTPIPPCMAQADVDDDGDVNSNDFTYLTSYLYGSGAEPPYPGPYNNQCVNDGTPSPLSCEANCDD